MKEVKEQLLFISVNQRSSAVQLFVILFFLGASFVPLCLGG
jgi:hypothetical protein